MLKTNAKKMLNNAKNKTPPKEHSHAANAPPMKTNLKTLPIMSFK